MVFRIMKNNVAFLTKHLILMAICSLMTCSGALAQIPDTLELLEMQRKSDTSYLDLQNALERQKSDDWSSSRPETLPGQTVKPGQASVSQVPPKQSSLIEQAYRTQYSGVLLKQLQSFQNRQLETLTPGQRSELLELQELQKQQHELDKMAGAKGGSNISSKLSAIANNFNAPPSTIIENQLTQFGYNIFRQALLRPALISSVPENYYVGPGDTIRINMWGTGADVQFEGMVQADGTIALPKLGVIPVGGIRYGDLQAVLTTEANKYIQGVNINVTLVKPRSIEVYVFGQVQNPGLTMMPAFSTVLVALTNAGGPLKTGSLRNISIYRNGRLHQTLDMYELIFSGNPESDIFLQDKDVIHVPYIGPTVAIVGAVNRPSIFEFSGKTTSVNEALKLAGGALPQALSQIYIRRYQAAKGLIFQEVDIHQTKQRHPAVQDGDLIEVRFIEKTFSTSIKVTGMVWDTKEYNHHSGMKISQIVPQPADLRPGAITEFALVKRYITEKAEFTNLRIPLSDIWSGNYDLELQPSDELEILSRADYKISRSVSLRGAVWKPSDFSYTDGLTVRDLIAMAGGLTDGANLSNIEITRQEIINNQTVISHNRVDLSNDTINIRLQPYDKVMIPEVKGVGQIPMVTIQGEVRFPGNYAIHDGERLSDLIARAGGFLPSAYLYGAQYTSPKAKRIQKEALNRLIDDLSFRIAGTAAGSAQISDEDSDMRSLMAAQQNFLAKLRDIDPTGRISIMLTDLQVFRGSKYDFELSGGEALLVPTKPSFVNIVGSVYSPNAYLYQPELMVKDYLAMAGGVTKTSDSKIMFVQKANGEVISVEQFGLFSSFHRQKLMPGDTIVVPEDIERIPPFKMFKEITDIVFRIAVSTGVIIGIL
jgi:polysaccharide biosynthesis/export protein